jgi:hypothetical protein
VCYQGSSLVPVLCGTRVVAEEIWVNPVSRLPDQELGDS